MKYNLKNFPYACEAGDMESWIRKFERELRKELEICDIGLPYCEKCEKVKEVLGEDSS